MNNLLKPVYLLILSFLLCCPLFLSSCKGKPTEDVNDTITFDADGKLPYEDTTGEPEEEEFEMEAQDVEIITQ